MTYFVEYLLLHVRTQQNLDIYLPLLVDKQLLIDLEYNIEMTLKYEVLAQRLSTALQLDARVFLPRITQPCPQVTSLDFVLAIT